MRREQRHRLTCAGHRLLLGAGGLGVAEYPVARDAIEHTVACALCRGGEAVGAAELGRLRQRDEKSSFAEREPARLLSEISERCCPDPFEVAAVRREREIKV